MGRGVRTGRGVRVGRSVSLSRSIGAAPDGDGAPVFGTYEAFRESGTFTVPAGVTSLRTRMLAAAGGGSYRNQGGGGGYVDATLSVTPGETLTVTIGTGGAAGSTGGAASGGTPGGGDGGVGTSFPGGGGGGLSAIYRGSTPLVVAGAGGAAGTTDYATTSNDYGDGGAGGGLTGGDGQPLSGTALSSGGGGGTQVAGGAAGAGDEPGSAGGALTGGDAATTAAADGAGGGGAGWYGGGSGATDYVSGGVPPADGAGGGGGSSYADPGASAVTHAQASGRTPGDGGALLAGWGGNPSQLNSGDQLDGQAGACLLTWEQAGEALPDALLDEDVLHLYVPAWELDDAAPELLQHLSQNAGLSAGDSLAALTDWRGGLHLRQSSGALQPTITNVGTPDSTWAVVTSGNSLLSSDVDVAHPSQLYVLAVWQPTGGAGGRSLVEQGPNPDIYSGWQIAERIGSTASVQQIDRDGALANAQAQIAASATAGYLTIEYVLDGATPGNRDVLVDDVSVLTGTSGTTAAAWSAVDRLHVLARADGSVGAVGRLRGLAICLHDVSNTTKTALKALITGA